MTYFFAIDAVSYTHLDVYKRQKLQNKFAYHHTGYIGHMKSVRYDILMRENPTKAMELAVSGMVPSNTIGRAALTRLRLFAGSEHTHAAQQPTCLLYTSRCV